MIDRHCPSPNYGDRRGGVVPDMVVLHYTAMATAQAALDRLCDPVAEVSCHYLIDEYGQITQLVPEDKRAWHAGAGSWGQVDDVNSHSIGIELANDGATPFSEAQYCALERLLADILSRWRIAPERVIGHSDMAPDRKFDPGPRFDWMRLAMQGVSVWPGRAEPGDFAACSWRFGYAATLPQDVVLAAFRQRFRPAATGPLDDQDRCLMADLAARFPVDRPMPTA